MTSPVLPESIEKGDITFVSDEATPAKAKLSLFVKAGKNKVRYGGCPFSHQTYMTLYIKFACRQNKINLSICTIDPNSPRKLFKNSTCKVPALLGPNVVLDDVEDMVQYVDQKFPQPYLTYFNIEAETAAGGFFSKLSGYIQNKLTTKGELLAELEKLNDYLGSTGYKFMCGASVTHLDCAVLPKLQHVRVAGKAFKSFHIPESLNHLWGYIYRGYKTKAFRITCPSNQEIIFFWLSNPSVPRLNPTQLGKYDPHKYPIYSFSTPNYTHQKKEQKSTA